MWGDNYRVGAYAMPHEYFWNPISCIAWGVIVLIIVLVVLRVLRGKHWRHHHHHHGGALETLRERYAKGEISTSEYEERKKALTAD